MKPKILVPYDFGPESVRALEWAVDLARMTGGSVHALHMLSLMPPVSMMASTPYTVVQEDLRAVEKSLQEVVAQTGLADASSSVQLSSSLGDTVVEVAKAQKSDLIVMGTHGRGAVARLVLGSVAEYVVRHASVPVVTMRAPATA